LTRLIVVENPENWSLEVPEAQVVAARDYLGDSRYAERRRAKVFNLCRNYSYQSTGYYVSLLAEARGHKVLPAVATLQDLRLSPVVRVASEDLEELAAKVLGAGERGKVGFNLYFGRTPAADLDRLAQALFRHFPSPFLRAEFAFAGRWRLDNVGPVGASEIPPEDRAFAAEQARRHFQRPAGEPGPSPSSRYDLAILFDPAAVDAPSDEGAIKKFVRAARTLGIEASVIKKEDAGRLAEYDALFLRETTWVNNHTYRFARRAEAEGLVVIDSPRSILRCTNKVFQAEAFARNGVPCPRTVVLHRDRGGAAAEALGFPLVLKRPDGSFSLGVVKVADGRELAAHLQKIFENSELAVAQEFVPSDFDWRIGILEGNCLYACKYHMARGHWQIRGGGPPERPRFGRIEAVPLTGVPPGVLEVAVKAAGLMGNDFYGVDVKQVDGRLLVVEVNDNPSIEAGYEDTVLKDELYLAVMRTFLTRLESRGVGPS
jgi:glutathione synthase/RimK-type ligase-like ATP-grasp enzyme